VYVPTTPSSHAIRRITANVMSISTPHYLNGRTACAGTERVLDSLARQNCKSSATAQELPRSRSIAGREGIAGVRGSRGW
jgi:hypothetical protein